MLSQARQTVPTPLLTHLTLLLRQRAQAMEERIRGFSGRREDDDEDNADADVADTDWTTTPSPPCAADSSRWAAL